MTGRTGILAAAILAGAFAVTPARADWIATGQFLYRDRVQDLTGFTGAEPSLPARRVDVQILDATTSAVLATGATGVDGTFSIPVVDAQVRSVRARAITLSSSTPGLLLDVRNNTSARQPYAITGAVVAGHAPGATVTLAGTLRYQACDDAICYLPKSVPVSWTIKIDAAPMK